MEIKPRIYTSNKRGSQLLALQYTGSNAGDVLEFCGGVDGSFYVNAKGAYVRTQKGDIAVGFGEYICIVPSVYENNPSGKNFFIYPKDAFEYAYCGGEKKQINDIAMQALNKADNEISVLGLDKDIKALVLEHIRTAKIWLHRS